MRGWHAETPRLSVAACQPSYLHCGAHSAQILQARVELHITLASWANKDHLSGRGFLKEHDIARWKSLTEDTVVRGWVVGHWKTRIQQQNGKKEWRIEMMHKDWDTAQAIRWYIKHVSSDTQSTELTTRDTESKKSDRSCSRLCHFHEFWKENERFSTIFPLQEC